MTNVPPFRNKTRRLETHKISNFHEKKTIYCKTNHWNTKITYLEVEAWL